MKFGPDYIIPKPFDPRVLVWEAVAVAKAAMETGVAQNPVDLAQYREQLERRLGKAHELMRIMIHKAKANPKRVVFPEGTHEKILRACHVLIEEKIAPAGAGGPEPRNRAGRNGSPSGDFLGGSADCGTGDLSARGSSMSTSSTTCGSAMG